MECFLSDICEHSWKVQVPALPLCWAKTLGKAVLLFLLAESPTSCIMAVISVGEWSWKKSDPNGVHRREPAESPHVSRNSSMYEWISATVPLISWDDYIIFSEKKGNNTSRSTSLTEDTVSPSGSLLQWQRLVPDVQAANSHWRIVFVLLRLTAELAVKMLLLLHVYVLLSVWTCLSVRCSHESRP